MYVIATIAGDIPRGQDGQEERREGILQEPLGHQWLGDPLPGDELAYSPVRISHVPADGGQLFAGSHLQRFCPGLHHCV